MTVEQLIGELRLTVMSDIEATKRLMGLSWQQLSRVAQEFHVSDAGMKGEVVARILRKRHQVESPVVQEQLL